MKPAYETPYDAPAVAVAEESLEARVGFLRQTYAHLLGALVALFILCFAIFQTGLAERIAGTLLGGRWSWLIALGAFMVVSMIAHKWASSQTSKTTQYLGLGIYVVAEAIILTPLLYIAHRGFPAHNIIGNAAVITALLFSGLTAVVFVTRKDFSFLRGILMIGGFAALGLIVCSIIFGFSLGLVFTVLMMALMCGYILYETSNVLHHYPLGSHVAASLALFASIATLFWYVVQFLMHFAGDD